MLKKDIRKALLETKEKKENLLIEQQIIKERFMMIVEDINNVKNFKKLPKSKREKISFSLMEEFIYLQQTGLINEQFGFMDILKNLFGGLFGSSAIETIAEPIVGKILDSIGFASVGNKDSLLKKTMISALTSNPADLAKALTDCRLMTKLLVKSFAEGLIMVLQDQMDKNGKLFNYFRNYLGGMIEKSGTASGIESKIGDTICGMFDSFTGNAKSIQDKLTGNQPTSTETSTDFNPLSKIKGLFGN
jgi:hypothetical protein